VTVALRRPYPSPEVARRIAAALNADNPAFVRVAVEGSALAIRLTADSPGSARATLDDLLACLQAAERAVPAA
jgi:hypothetical protein